MRNCKSVLGILTSAGCGMARGSGVQKEGSPRTSVVLAHSSKAAHLRVSPLFCELWRHRQDAQTWSCPP